MNTPYLSIVIPCYDEMANLQKGVLDKVQQFLNHKKTPYEVIIVDDGSTDGSGEFVEQFVKHSPNNFRLIKNQHLGKAGTVTTGMLQGKGKYILFSDMDQATPIEEVDKLLPYFEKGYDVVIGSRDNRRKGAPLSRLFVSRAAIILRKIFLGMDDISDTQCGFKAFTYDAANDLFSRIKKLHNGFEAVSGSNVTAGFDMELLYLARKKKYKIKEVPVSWLYVETRRVSPIRDSIEGVMELISIKLNDLSGKYNQ